MYMTKETGGGQEEIQTELNPAKAVTDHGSDDEAGLNNKHPLKYTSLFTFSVHM